MGVYYQDNGTAKRVDGVNAPTWEEYEFDSPSTLYTKLSSLPYQELRQCYLKKYVTGARTRVKTTLSGNTASTVSDSMSALTADGNNIPVSGITNSSIIFSDGTMEFVLTSSSMSYAISEIYQSGTSNVFESKTGTTVSGIVVIPHLSEGGD